MLSSTANPSCGKIQRCLLTRCFVSSFYSPPYCLIYFSLLSLFSLLIMFYFSHHLFYFSPYCLFFLSLSIFSPYSHYFISVLIVSSFYLSSSSYWPLLLSLILDYFISLLWPFLFHYSAVLVFSHWHLTDFILSHYYSDLSSLIILLAFFFFIILPHILTFSIYWSFIFSIFTLHCFIFPYILIFSHYLLVLHFITYSHLLIIYWYCFLPSPDWLLSSRKSGWFRSLHYKLGTHLLEEHSWN